MEPIYLFDIASRQARWLAARQAAVAGNIANVDTPGFRARDVEPFAEVLDGTRVEMARTSAAHLTPAAFAPGGAGTAESDGWEIKHSGNSVTLEAELLKAGEVTRGFRLNTGIVGAFHKLMLTGVKG